MTIITNTLSAAWAEARKAAAYAANEMQSKGPLLGTHALLNDFSLNLVHRIWTRSNDFASQYIPKKISFVAGLISLTACFWSVNYVAVKSWRPSDKGETPPLKRFLDSIFKIAALAVILFTGVLAYGCVGEMGYRGWPAYLISGIVVSAQYLNLEDPPSLPKIP